MDDQLFEILNSNTSKREGTMFSIDIKPKFRNINIKSRIGEIERVTQRSLRKTTSRVQRRVKIRSSSPWVFTGDSHSIVASPFTDS